MVANANFLSKNHSLNGASQFDESRMCGCVLALSPNSLRNAAWASGELTKHSITSGRCWRRLVLLGFDLERQPRALVLRWRWPAHQAARRLV